MFTRTRMPTAVFWANKKTQSNFFPQVFFVILNHKFEKSKSRDISRSKRFWGIIFWAQKAVYLDILLTQPNLWNWKHFFLKTCPENDRNRHPNNSPLIGALYIPSLHLFFIFIFCCTLGVASDSLPLSVSRVGAMVSRIKQKPWWQS